MKVELICDNCGSKRFEFRMGSRRLGGWDENGERESGTERHWCMKCGCCVSIVYEQKLDEKRRLEIEYKELGDYLLGKNRKSNKKVCKKSTKKEKKK